MSAALMSHRDIASTVTMVFRDYKMLHSIFQSYPTSYSITTVLPLLHNCVTDKDSYLPPIQEPPWIHKPIHFRHYINITLSHIAYWSNLFPVNPHLPPCIIYRTPVHSPPVFASYTHLLPPHDTNGVAYWLHSHCGFLTSPFECLCGSVNTEKWKTRSISKKSIIGDY